MLDLDSNYGLKDGEEILFITWYDYTPLMRAILERSLLNTVELIHKLKTVKIVFKCSFLALQPSEQEFSEIVQNFLSALAITGTRKVALLNLTGHEFDAKFPYAQEKALSGTAADFTVEVFSAREAALTWLEEVAMKQSQPEPQFA